VLGHTAGCGHATATLRKPSTDELPWNQVANACAQTELVILIAHNVMKIKKETHQRRDPTFHFPYGDHGYGAEEGGE
jgi:hypothetical protein